MNKLLITLAAFLFYGGWAVYSNWMDGSSEEVIIAWRAGAIQGGYAALLTLITMIILLAVYRRIARFVTAGVARIGSVAMTTGLQYSVIVPVHLLNQTPNIILTLLPGLVIGSIFSLTYIYRYGDSSN